VTGSCRYSYMRGGEFLEQLGYRQLDKKDSTPWNSRPSSVHHLICLRSGNSDVQLASESSDISVCNWSLTAAMSPCTTGV
jgi:hypothetical protein